MVERKSMKYIITIGAIVILIFSNIAFVSITDSPSYIVNYFINPIFLYLPMIVFDIAVILCIIILLIKKRRFLKIIAIILVCVLMMYWGVCFSILTHSKTNNYNKLCDLQSISKQIIDSIFSEYSNGIDLDYEQDTSYAFCDSLLFESSDTYDIKANENSGSCFIDIYCFDNYPILCSEKSISKLENTYFHSEYAYSLSNSVFGKDDIVSGVKDGVAYQYCCIVTTNDESLKNDIYFSVLLQDDNSVFLVSVLIHQKEYMDVNVEKELENILIFTEQLWNI